MATFEWNRSLATGAAGSALLVRALEAQGRRVIDITQFPPAQMRDVDYIVDDDLYVEVKSDTHPAKNFFFELSVGNKPGCVFASRADVWVYVFPKDRVAYWLNLPRLQQWLALNAHRYPLKLVGSRRGTRHWSATGIAVPISHLMYHVFTEDDISSLEEEVA